MRGDFSLLRPDLSDYSLVLMQQGRVLVESDWNAAMATLISAQRTLAADLIGPHGGPNADNLGFAVTLTQDKKDVELSPGVYYVDGIRCELALELVPHGSDGLPWSQQPYPIAVPPPELPTDAYLVYLDVWERHVSTVEDDTIREVALGGPDTTSRRKIIWQVRVMPYPAGGTAPTCQNFPLDKWPASLLGNPPKLCARTGPQLKDGDPCLASPDARYRGVENQLYRVEIASVAAPGGGEDAGVTSFVWSRENGSVAAPWTATANNRLRVAGIRDTRRGFAPNDWVELTWDTLEFAGIAGTRVQLTDVDGPVLTIDPDTASGDIDPEPSKHGHAKIRRWDQRDSKAAPIVHGAVEVVESNDDSGWIPLEDGIEIQFQAAGGQHDYRVGDYWTIPARVATGDIIWPREDGAPVAVPPHGIEHHYAPLAWFSGETADPVSLQKVFPLAACARATQQRRGNR
ncbi:DUF6519 domain-containing protein [Mycobacterium sp.]|uniref:DUF6519 domain-containing protein n=1 Tax=Mycobacterium sp. TaxID=1785 RepID=UPI002C3A748D|nr:DUF6519 domain-containing protein [Mycobacterium sp.]HTY32928.1 DUF6519 domain-containing protein [Mycobacterium sp.]